MSYMNPTSYFFISTFRSVYDAPIVTNCKVRTGEPHLLFVSQASHELKIAGSCGCWWNIDSDYYIHGYVSTTARETIVPNLIVSIDSNGMWSAAGLIILEYWHHSYPRLGTHVLFCSDNSKPWMCAGIIIRLIIKESAYSDLPCLTYNSLPFITCYGLPFSSNPSSC
jgi:hypothetical protein